MGESSNRLPLPSLLNFTTSPFSADSPVTQWSFYRLLKNSTGSEKGEKKSNWPTRRDKYPPWSCRAQTPLLLHLLARDDGVEACLGWIEGWRQVRALNQNLPLRTLAHRVYHSAVMPQIVSANKLTKKDPIKGCYQSLTPAYAISSHLKLEHLSIRVTSQLAFYCLQKSCSPAPSKLSFCFEA